MNQNNNVELLAKVFVRDSSGGPVMGDLPSLTWIVHNCTYFDDSLRQVMPQLRNIRNKYFAHNIAMELNASQVKESFRVLKKVLRCPQLAGDDLAATATEDITKLEKNSVDDKYKSAMTQILSNKDINLPYNIQHTNANRTKHSAYRRAVRPSSFRTLFVASAVLCLTFIPQEKNDLTMKDCVNMDFTYPWKSDISFKHFINEHKHFIGREWLFRDLENMLHHASMGVLVTADMGFGKSAALAHLACVSYVNEYGYSLRQRMVAFHICKYDIQASLRPDYFIRNLAGGIVSQSSEYGNILFGDRMAMAYLDSDKCREDPVGCFDFVIHGPLNQMLITRPFVVMIDALDECLEYYNDELSIVGVLSKRLYKLRFKIQILATSRNTPSILSALPLLKLKEINSSCDENINDITKYIDTKIQSSERYFSLPDVLLSHNSLKKKIKRYSGGNFLLVVHLLSSNVLSFDDLPETLQDMYRLNFDRIFKTRELLFEDLKPVLEILSASELPVDVNRLLEIAKYKNNNFSTSKIRKLLDNEFKQFITHSIGKISFVHKAVSDFLTNKKHHHQYHISKQDGHKRIATYLLRDNKSDVLEVLTHVAECNSSDIRRIFREKGKRLFKEKLVMPNVLTSNNILFHACRSLNSYVSIQLLLEIIGKSHVDRQTDRNVTATFIAAAYGHTETLKALIDSGANAYFTRPNTTVFVSGNDSNFVLFVKKVSFSGYNLLHIASQNGRTETVAFLINTFPKLLRTMTSFGSTSFHLAIENRHEDVTRAILWKNSSFADSRALYFASKSGNANIVRLLLYHNASDKCLPCNDTVYWVPMGSSRLQNIEGHRLDNKNKSYIVLDDEQFIKCESALEVAIKNGQLEIVQLLLNEKNTTLHCMGRGGRTPLLTAVFFNYTDVFARIRKKDDNVTYLKCQPMYNSSFLDVLDEFEKHDLTLNTCSSGTSVAHIAAMNDNIQMLKKLSRELLQSKDVYGNTPWHYAACHGNRRIISFFLQKGISFLELSYNGSTILHSAAACKNERTLVLLEREYNFIDLISVKDKMNRTYFHTLECDSCNVGILPKSGKQQINEYYYTQSKFAISFLYEVDINGENVCHYASRSGNSKFYDYYLHNNYGYVYGIMQKQNRNGHNALDVAFNSLNPNTKREDFNIPEGCTLDSLFLTPCSMNYEQYLTSHEYVIWRIIHHYNRNGNNRLTNRDMMKYITIAVEKDSIMCVLILRTFQAREFDKALRSFSDNALTRFLDINPSPTMSSYVIPKHIRICNQPFPLSIMHKILHNLNGRYSSFSPTRSRFIHSFIDKMSSDQIDNCFDKSGFNLMHRAVMGGNFEAVKYLLFKNASMSITAKTGETVLTLLIQHAPFIHHSTHFKADMVDHIGIIALLLKDQYFKASLLNSNVLCERDSLDLSLAHTLAAKGMSSALHFLANHFGRVILNCTNTWGLTPLYLAKLFDHQEVINLCTKSGLKFRLPDKKVEKTFLLFISLQLFDKTLYHMFRNIVYSSYPFSTINHVRRLMEYLCKAFIFKVFASENIAFNKLYCEFLYSMNQIFKPNMKILPDAEPELASTLEIMIDFITYEVFHLSGVKIKIEKLSMVTETNYTKSMSLIDRVEWFKNNTGHISHSNEHFKIFSENRVLINSEYSWIGKSILNTRSTKT